MLPGVSRPSRATDESWHVATGIANPSAPTLLADRTLVFVDSSGQVVAVKEGAVRWTVPLGLGGSTSKSSVALEDGGVAASSGRVVALFDVDGALRARATIPAGISTPLVGFRGTILAADSTGAVWSWRPGPGSPQRIGTFGEPVDAFAATGGVLVAVTHGGTRVVALDVATGEAHLMAEAGSGERFYGPAARGPHRRMAERGGRRDGRDTRERGCRRGRTRWARASSHSSRGPFSTPAGRRRRARLRRSSHSSRCRLVGTLVFATSEGDVGVVHGDTVLRTSSVCPSSGGPNEKSKKLGWPSLCGRAQP